AANKVPGANGASAVHSRLRRGSLVLTSMPITTSIYGTPTARVTPFHFVQRSSNSFRRQTREGRNPTLSSRRLEAHQRINLSPAAIRSPPRISSLVDRTDAVELSLLALCLL